MHSVRREERIEGDRLLGAPPTIRANPLARNSQRRLAMASSIARTPNTRPHTQHCHTHLCALLIAVTNFMYGGLMGMGLIKLIENHTNPSREYRPIDAAKYGATMTGSAAVLYASIPIIAEYGKCLTRRETPPKIKAMLWASLLPGVLGAAIGLGLSILLTQKTQKDQALYIGVSTVTMAAWLVLLHLKWIMRTSENQSTRRPINSHTIAGEAQALDALPMIALTSRDATAFHHSRSSSTHIVKALPRTTRGGETSPTTTHNPMHPPLPHE